MGVSSTLFSLEYPTPVGSGPSIRVLATTPNCICRNHSPDTAETMPGAALFRVALSFYCPMLPFRLENHRYQPMCEVGKLTQEAKLIASRVTSFVKGWHPQIIHQASLKILFSAFWCLWKVIHECVRKAGLPTIKSAPLGIAPRIQNPLRGFLANRHSVSRGLPQFFPQYGVQA